MALRFSRRHIERRLLKRGRVIYAFWHGRLLLLAYTHRRRKIHIMISEHRDGEMIARVTQQLGFGAVRGSTTRGRIQALKGMVRAVRRFDGAITPDGPRGPRAIVQPGTISAAQLSGAPILPVTSAAYPRWQFSSWDRFVMPKPFACCVVRFGNPLFVPRRLTKEEFEQWRLKLQRELNRITEEADIIAKRWAQTGRFCDIP